jgi:hypothetical protein
MEIKHSHVVLDACCVLNFCASGYLIEILESISSQVAVTEVVIQRELLTLKKLQDEDERDENQFDLAIQKGMISVVDFNTDIEEETFISYVFELGDDGESATGAIALHRDWAIATDMPAEPIPRLSARKAQRSRTSSITLAVGLPAP